MSLLPWPSSFGADNRAGEFRDFATRSRNRTRKRMSEQASAWWNCIEGLPAVHARLKRVVILNDDAIKVIRAEDGEKTLFYLDPPYIHETRTTKGNYQHEMTEGDHQQLLATIKQCCGKVMLSGYPNAVYEQALAGWCRRDFHIDNKAAGGKSKRQMTESVWMNF
jgi:DNA adenine methylase